MFQDTQFDNGFFNHCSYFSFTYFKISYRRNHLVCIFLCLYFFKQHVSEIHPCCMHLRLWDALNYINIPQFVLYIYLLIFFFANMTKALYESFGYSISFPIFGIITHLNIVPSGDGAMTFPCYFNMHFSDDKSCWAFFHMFIGHL